MKNLYESLLDDFDDLVAKQDKGIATDWCEKNFQGKYKIKVSKKDGSIKLVGDVVLKDYKEDFIPIKIAFMQGDFKIEKCPNLTSIDGLFADFMTIEGDFSINNCEKLTSLKGCPMIVHGSFSLTGNTSLYSLEGAPEIVHGTTYVMKNGKKFKENTIKQYIKMPMRIVCSMEDEEVLNEGMVNEALNEPHLLELVDQLKKKNPKFNVKNLIFDRITIPWDEIDSSDVKEYSNIDTKALTKARNIISGRDDARGIILLRNSKDEYTYIIHRKEIISLHPDSYMYRWGPGWTDEKSTELMYYVERADSMVIISWDWNMSNKRYTKRRDRGNARSGMILNTPEYYESVARENLDRYKKIIAQNRANKMNDAEFDKIDKDVEAIIQKTLQLTIEYRKKATSGDKNQGIWDAGRIENINRDIYDKKVYVGYNRGRDGYSGSNGLLPLYAEFNRCFVRFKADGDVYYERQMKQYKDELLSKIKELKHILGL